jgi:hypothetical protein
MRPPDPSSPFASGSRPALLRRIVASSAVFSGRAKVGVMMFWPLRSMIESPS